MTQAAADNKYLFAFFWNTDNDQTAAMKKVFEDATAKVADRAMTVSVRVSDPAESGIVKKYDLERAPMPLVLAIAPNGAIMGGFPTKFEEQELLNAFSSPGTEKCMKALQEASWSSCAFKTTRRHPTRKPCKACRTSRRTNDMPAPPRLWFWIRVIRPKHPSWAT